MKSKRKVILYRRRALLEQELLNKNKLFIQLLNKYEDGVLLDNELIANKISILTLDKMVIFDKTVCKKICKIFNKKFPHIIFYKEMRFAEQSEISFMLSPIETKSLFLKKIFKICKDLVFYI